ncbi:MAG: SAM-dependent DNA methyltransferase, partial [Candidatus Electrothrix sp. AR5]|nr:SAM-dependent DNA methyltransferase [Candidatus Electrothrix sp. AR5]
MGSMVDRTHKELTAEDIAEVVGVYHAWRGESPLPSGVGEGGKEYQDVAGFCKTATLAEIAANDYVLTPGRYVGAAEIEDDGIPFEDKMGELSKALYQQMAEAGALDAVIRGNLEVLGYGEA